MFEDIAPNMNVQASDITKGKFLGKGTFGSVFRGELRQESGNSITIAMKMPLNNEVGDDAPAEEKQMAAAAMRALKENPTVTLNDAYRWEDSVTFIFFFISQWEASPLKSKSLQISSGEKLKVDQLIKGCSDGLIEKLNKTSL